MRQSRAFACAAFVLLLARPSGVPANGDGAVESVPPPRTVCVRQCKGAVPAKCKTCRCNPADDVACGRPASCPDECLAAVRCFRQSTGSVPEDGWQKGCP